MLLPRSYLFVPANRPALYDKALASGADAVIVDLEDAVGASAKSEARDALANWLTPHAGVIVRVNAATTSWHGDDLAVCAHPGVVAISIPKVEAPDDLGLVSWRRRASQALLPFIESAQALERARAIAQVNGVQRLIFGSLDFQVDLGIDDDDQGLAFFRSQLVYQSRLAGVGAPVDGVTKNFSEPDAVIADTARARRLGFGAKLCIHPKQVAHVNAAFAPTVDEIAHAERVVAADLASQGNVTSVDGLMIDRPVLEHARLVLSRAAPR